MSDAKPSLTAVARYVGIDGFRWGWVAASIERSGAQYFDYGPSLTRLLREPYDRAMIDMPIGLPTSSNRSCDIEARQIVGPSVFVGARRSLFDFVSHEEANAGYRQRREPGVSIQLWSMREKLCEVDVLKTSRSASTLYEAHPELVFRRLNAHRALPKKKSQDGRELRISLLEKMGFTKVRKWLGERFRTGIGSDDLIDACACAVAARDALNCLPEKDEPPDEKGLVMRIWY